MVGTIRNLRVSASWIAVGAQVESGFAHAVIVHVSPQHGQQLVEIRNVPSVVEARRRRDAQ